MDFQRGDIVRMRFRDGNFSKGTYLTVRIANCSRVYCAAGDGQTQWVSTNAVTRVAHQPALWDDAATTKSYYLSKYS